MSDDGPNNRGLIQVELSENDELDQFKQIANRTVQMRKTCGS